LCPLRLSSSRMAGGRVPSTAAGEPKRAAGHPLSDALCRVQERSGRAGEGEGGQHAKEIEPASGSDGGVFSPFKSEVTSDCQETRQVDHFSSEKCRTNQVAH